MIGSLALWLAGSVLNVDLEPTLYDPKYETLVGEVRRGALGLNVALVGVLLYLGLRNLQDRKALDQIKDGLHRYWKGWSYLLDAPAMILRGYQESGDRPYFVPTPSNKHLLVSSAKDIQEVYDAPADTLSIAAVALEWLQPKYTMHGFEWGDQRGDEGIGFVRVLRSLLPANLPALIPKMQMVIDDLLLPSSKDGSPVALFPLMKKIVVRANTMIFFGEKFTTKQEFTDAALQYPEAVVLTAELLRLIPTSCASAVAYLTTRGHAAEKTIYRYLEPEVDKRLAKLRRERESGIPEGQNSMDCMQWLIDTSPRKNPWTSWRMIGEIMAVWFGSVHQLSMSASFAILDLCDYPEYYNPLRAEAITALRTGSQHYPLLDSFLRESARYSCGDAVSTRRKALKPWSLSSGAKLAVGDWVCVPQAAMAMDEALCSNPGTFDGFRYASAEALSTLKDPTFMGKRENEEAGVALTDLTDRGLFWGMSKMACPGRFYASALLKLIMAHLLVHYECPRKQSAGKTSFSWRSTIVPRAGYEVWLQPKGVEEHHV